MSSWDDMVRDLKSKLSGFFRGGEDSNGPGNRIKMCPSCGRFVDKDAVQCEYCDQVLRAKPTRTVGQAGEPISLDLVNNPTKLIFGVCVVFYVVSLYFSTMENNYSIASNFWSPNPFTLAYMGSSHYSLTFGHGEFWRLVNYMFLHGGLMHLAFNLMALAQLGPITSQNYGLRRFWIITLLAGIGGGLASSLFGALPFVRGAATVGFSGALFGYIGLNYVYFKSNGYLGVAERFKSYMIWGNVICILLTTFGIMRIDNLAHLGGMFTGMGLGYLLESPHAARLTKGREQTLLLLLASLAAWGLVMGGRYLYGVYLA